MLGVAVSGRTSNCSLGVRVDFYWHDCASADGHLDAAEDALFESVSQSESRRWNPHTEAMARAEFRDRLEAAERGELKPIDEVKEIGEGSVLFEIRWLDLPVTDQDPSGTIRHSHTDVRLYHAEPVQLSLCALGLHAAEKPHGLADRDVRDLQDAAIAEALRRYWEGEGSRWGLPG